MTVDDDVDLQMSIVDILEDKGFGTVAVADGLEALNLLRRGFRPSVILLDLMMPGVDGWSFRREQSKDVDLRNIPVVVTTAERLDETTRTIALGNVGWLPKPFGLDALVTAIESALLPARKECIRPGDDKVTNEPNPRGHSS